MKCKNGRGTAFLDVINHDLLSWYNYTENISLSNILLLWGNSRHIIKKIRYQKACV